MLAGGDLCQQISPKDHPACSTLIPISFSEIVFFVLLQMASKLPDVIDEELLCCPLCLCNFCEPKLLPCLHTFCRACLEDYIAKLAEEDAPPCTAIPCDDATSTTTTTSQTEKDNPPKDHGVSQTVPQKSRGERFHGDQPPPIKPKPEVPKSLLTKRCNTSGDTNQTRIQEISHFYEPVKEKPKVSESPDELSSELYENTDTDYISKPSKIETSPRSVKSMIMEVERGTLNKEIAKRQTSLKIPPQRKYNSSQRYVKTCVTKYKSELKLTARNSFVLEEQKCATQNNVNVTKGKVEVHKGGSSEVKDNTSVRSQGREEINVNKIDGNLAKAPSKTAQDDRLSHVTTTKVEAMAHCPTCLMDFILPTNGVRGIKTNAFIVGLQEIVFSQSNGDKFCNNCETSSATFRCLDCRHYLCRGCRNAHNWLKITRNHHVMTLCELQSGKYQGELKRQLQIKCDIHTNNNVQVMCLYCDKPICSECKMSDHTDHRTGALTDAAVRDRDLIKSLINSVKTQQDLFSNSAQKLDAYEEQCKLEKKEIICDIQRQRDQLVQLLNECALDLSNEIAAAYSEELLQKENMQEQMRAVVTHMKHNGDFATQLLKHGTTEDILVMAKPIKVNLNNFSFVSPSDLDTRPFVQYTPSTITKPSLVPFFGRLAKRRNSVIAPFAIKLEKTADTPQVDTTTQPLCELASFRSRTIQDPMGCKPTSISVTANDDIIIVDDINKKVKVFDPTGYVKLELWPLGSHALVDPWDVAITHEGHLAITDRGAHNVKIYKTSGECVLTFGPHLKSPWGIAANSKANLIVSDIKVKAVFVHDAEGRLLYPIECKGHANLFMCPEYVAINNNDDIIISDFEKHCITVFDSQGRFLYRYGNRGRGPHDFNVPCGVCVDNEGCILVVDYNNRRVHKLSRDGQFEQFVLSHVHGLRTPQAIAVNSFGHLLVLDGTDVKTFGHRININTTPVYEPLQFSNAMYEGVTIAVPPTDCETDV